MAWVSKVSSRHPEVGGSKPDNSEFLSLPLFKAFPAVEMKELNHSHEKWKRDETEMILPMSMSNDSFCCSKLT